MSDANKTYTDGLRNGTLTTVLFDWDGTLCDSGRTHWNSFRSALADFGITITLEQFKAVYTPAWYRMYEAFGLPRSDWPNADQRWLFHYGEQDCDLMAGAGSVVDTLVKAGLQLGIVSGGNRSRIERELARQGMSNIFHPLVGYEDVVEKKPHPEGIHKALALLHSAPETCCYVGDTPEDIYMGQAAGVYTVALVTEYVDLPRMQSCAADVLLDSIAQLPGLLLNKPISDRS